MLAISMVLSIGTTTVFAVGYDVPWNASESFSPEDVFIEAPHSDESEEGGFVAPEYEQLPEYPGDQPGYEDLFGDGTQEQEPDDGSEPSEESENFEYPEEPEPEEEPEMPQTAFVLSFRFEGELAITPEMYDQAFEQAHTHALVEALTEALANGRSEEGIDKYYVYATARTNARAQLFLNGVYVNDEGGQPFPDIQIGNDGMFDITAAPGTAFIITYTATHPMSGEVFSGTRQAVVTSEEEGIIGITPLTGFTVTFQGNDGVWDANTFQTRDTVLGDIVGIGNAPLEPLNPGFTFRHWNTVQNIGAAIPGTVFTETTLVTQDMPVYAQWGRAVTFNPNAAGLPSIDALIVPQGYSVNTTPATVGMPPLVWPDDPVRSGFQFMGWFDEPLLGDGTEFDADSTINGNIPLFAQWKLLPAYIVNFEPNGGALASGQQDTREAIPGRSIAASFSSPYFSNQGILWPRSAPQITSRPRPSANNGNVGEPLANLTFTGWHPQQDTNAAGRHFAPAINTSSLGLTSHAATAYQFGGNRAEWSNVPVTSDMVDSNGEVTVYARWVYRVHFHTNAGPEFHPIHNRYRDVIVSDATIAADGGSIADYGTRTFVPGNNNAFSTSVDNPGDIVDARSFPEATRPGFSFHGWWNMQLPQDTTVADAVNVHGARMLEETDLINSSGRVWALWHRETDDIIIEFYIDPSAGGSWYIPPMPSGPTTTAQVAAREAAVFNGFRTIPAYSNFLTLAGGNNANLVYPAHLPSAQRVTAMPRFPVRPGYVFTGWFVGPPESIPTAAVPAIPNPPIAAPGMRVNMNTIFEEDTRVYARWRPAHTITFDPNANSGELSGIFLEPRGSSQRLIANGLTVANMNTLWIGQGNGAYWTEWYEFGSTVNTGFMRRSGGAGPVVTRPGYENFVLLGWNSEPDGRGINFVQNIAINDSMTVYAQWAPTLRFHTNISGAVTEYTRTHNVAFNRTLPTHNLHEGHASTLANRQQLFMPEDPDNPSPWAQLHVANHAFLGWNTERDGSGLSFSRYTVVTEELLSDHGNNGILNLYAQWFENGVGFDSGHAPDSVILPQHRQRQLQSPLPSTLEDSLAVGIFTPTYDGMPDPPYWPDHEFMGWRSAITGGTIVADTPIGEPMMLIAQWRAAFTFNANNGEFSAGVTTVSDSSTAIGANFPTIVSSAGASSPQRTSGGGWSLAGWNSAPDGSGITYGSNSIITQGRTVFAQWQGNVTFQLNGTGAVWPANSGGSTRTLRENESISSTTGISMPPDPTRPGHAFLGWNTEADGTGDDFTQDCLMTDGHMNVYAQWEVTDVTVTLLVEDGSSPAIGVGSPTITLIVPNEPAMVLGGVGTDSVTIDPPITPVTTTLTITGLNSNWFSVEAHVRIGDTGSWGSPINLDETGTAPALTWTADPAIQIDIGDNVYVRVTIEAIVETAIDVSVLEINYGAHIIDFVDDDTIQLGDDTDNGDDPEDVIFTIFHHDAAEGWTLDVRSEAHTGTGNDALANRLWSERIVGTTSFPLYNTDARAANS
ncbi:MAG: InlB B-repeat-containing protein, partial [Oscillospiraceae bacterium]|nr:InlB B-repeat-containing protein [Oscillospiraceae bacterium]